MSANEVIIAGFGAWGEILARIQSQLGNLMVNY